MKLYLAGGMSGYPELNFPAFHAEAARLRAMGYTVINPAEIVTDQTAEWIDCMLADIPQLIGCDGIALLPGWEASKGARIEHSIARALGKLVLECAAVPELEAA